MKKPGNGALRRRRSLPRGNRRRYLCRVLCRGAEAAVRCTLCDFTAPWPRNRKKVESETPGRPALSRLVPISRDDSFSGRRRPQPDHSACGSAPLSRAGFPVLLLIAENDSDPWRVTDYQATRNRPPSIIPPARTCIARPRSWKKRAPNRIPNSRLVRFTAIM